MNAVANITKPSPVDAFVGEVLPPDRRQSLFSGMPAHIKPAVFERNLVNAVMANTNLMKYDPRLVYREVSKAAGLGLLLDPQLGEAYIIEAYNYKTRSVEPLLRVGYRGLVKLARQSGEIEQVYAHEVYSQDHLDCDLGVEKRLAHKPILFSDRGVVIGYYAVVKYKGGDYDFEPMSVDEVHAIRDRSDAWKAFKDGKIKSTPWSTDDVEMSKKTVIRRLVKRVPQSPELADALRLEDQAEGVIEAAVRAVTPSRLPPAPPAARQIAHVEAPQDEAQHDPETSEIEQGEATEQKAEEAKPARQPPKPADTKVTSGLASQKSTEPSPEVKLDQIKAILEGATSPANLEEVLASDARPIFNTLSEADQKKAIKLYEAALARLMDASDDGEGQQVDEEAYTPEPILAEIQRLFEDCDSEERLELVREKQALPLYEKLSRSDQEKATHLYNVAQKRILEADAAEAGDPIGPDERGHPEDDSFPGDKPSSLPPADKKPEKMDAAELEAHIRGYIETMTDTDALKKRWYGDDEHREILSDKVRQELRTLWKARTEELRAAEGQG